MTKYVMRVRSDNFSGYMTQEAYAEFRLQLSTGDYHTHEHVLWPTDSLTDSQLGEVVTLEEVSE
jgi:hypothetical protein